MANEVLFHSTKTLNFQVLNEVVPATTDIVNFQSTVLFGVTKGSKSQEVRLIIRHFVAITIRPKDGGQNTPCGMIETESYFIIPEILSYFEENFGYKIPREIVIPLIEAANSTTRGIALMRGAGTLLDSMPIPMLNGKSVLSDMETVDIPIPQEDAVKAGLVTA